MLTAAERYRGSVYSVYKVDPDDIEEMAFCEDSDRFLMCGDGYGSRRRGAGHAGVMRPAGVRLAGPSRLYTRNFISWRI